MLHPSSRVARGGDSEVVPDLALQHFPLACDSTIVSTQIIFNRWTEVNWSCCQPVMTHENMNCSKLRTSSRQFWNGLLSLTWGRRYILVFVFLRIKTSVGQRKMASHFKNTDVHDIGVCRAALATNYRGNDWGLPVKLGLEKERLPRVPKVGLLTVHCSLHLH